MRMTYREHDTGGYQYRVWSEEDAKYGFFYVVSVQELAIIAKACKLMGGTCLPADDCDINFGDFKDYNIVVG